MRVPRALLSHPGLGASPLPSPGAGSSAGRAHGAARPLPLGTRRRDRWRGQFPGMPGARWRPGRVTQPSGVTELTGRVRRTLAPTGGGCSSGGVRSSEGRRHGTQTQTRKACTSVLIRPPQPRLPTLSAAEHEAPHSTGRWSLTRAAASALAGGGGPTRAGCPVRSGALGPIAGGADFTLEAGSAPLS